MKLTLVTAERVGERSGNWGKMEKVGGKRHDGTNFNSVRLISSKIGYLLEKAVQK